MRFEIIKDNDVWFLPVVNSPGHWRFKCAEGNTLDVSDKLKDSIVACLDTSTDFQVAINIDPVTHEVTLV